MAPFINIHTHQNQAVANCISLHNIFLQKLSEINYEKSVFYSVGIHPWHVGEIDIQLLENQMLAAFENPQIIAVGEIGLDKVCEIDFEKQLKYFFKQIEIVEKYQFPVVIHCVRAFNEIIEFRKNNKISQSWIFHHYNANEQITNELLKYNCYFSFGKNVLNNSDKINELIKFIPSNNLFLETDDTTITISEIYEKVAEIKNCSVEELKFAIIENFQRCFSFPIADTCHKHQQ